MYISRRLSLGGKNKVAAVIAVAGVSCALVVVLLTIAIAVGFKVQITEKLRGFTPDIAVQPAYDYDYGQQEQFIDSTARTIARVHEVLPGVRAWSFVRQPGVLKTADDFATVVFTGMDGGADMSFQNSILEEGRLPHQDFDWKTYEIAVSRVTASRLGLGIGDRIDVCFFADGRIRARKFTVTGIFASNFGDFDKTVCFACADALRHICKIAEDMSSGIEVKGPSMAEIPEAADALQRSFITEAQARGADKVVVVDNITHSGAMYLGWLDLLDTNVAVILALMSSVAGFTLISSLFILILNSVSAIGILRALGMTKGDVRHIFVLLALRLVGTAMIVGNIVALGIIFVQGKYGVIPLDPEMYYLAHVPVQLSFTSWAIVNAGVAVFAWLVLVLPARLASSVNPATTIRYE